MKMVKLSERVSLSGVVQGFWRLGKWGWTAKELASFMNACIERGVTSFDTAEVYANFQCERMIGDAFMEDKTLRGRIQLVSKTGIFRLPIDGKVFGYYNTTYDRIMQSCKESLQKLHTDHLDLYLIHREDPCFDPWETARALKELKKDGLILEAGVSNFDPFKFDAIYQAMDGDLVTDQVECSPVCFEHFNNGLMDRLTYLKIHPMIWSPLAGGRLFVPGDEVCERAMAKIQDIAQRHNVEPATIIYAWLMYHPVGAVPISGSNKISRLELAVRALDVKLEHHEWYEIYAASGQQVIR